MSESDGQCVVDILVTNIANKRVLKSDFLDFCILPVAGAQQIKWSFDLRFRVTLTEVITN